MPSLRQQITIQSAIVQKLAELQQLIESNRRDNVRYAREMGEILRGVATEERSAVWTAAGIKRRMAFNYMSVAAHWPAVQRAASIRGALALIGRQRQAGPGRDVPLPFEDDGRCVVTQHNPARPVHCRDG